MMFVLVVRDSLPALPWATCQVSTSLRPLCATWLTAPTGTDVRVNITFDISAMEDKY